MCAIGMVNTCWDCYAIFTLNSATTYTSTEDWLYIGVFEVAENYHFTITSMQYRYSVLNLDLFFSVHPIRKSEMRDERAR